MHYKKMELYSKNSIEKWPVIFIEGIKRKQLKEPIESPVFHSVQ